MADEYDPLDTATYSAAVTADTVGEEYDPADADASGQDEMAEDGDNYNPTAPNTYGHEETAEDDDDDYDPSSMTFDTNPDQASSLQVVQPLHQPPTPSELPPPKTQQLAGFIVEESDDEQDASALPPPLQQQQQQNGLAGARPGADTVAASEQQDVSLRSDPQDTAADGTSLNASTTLQNPPVSTSVTPLQDSSLHPPTTDQGKAVSPDASAVPTPQPLASSLAPPPTVTAQPNGTSTAQPARLPHDRVGQLEDRIKEDPKGDVDAWTGLIDHYNGKGQYDLTRSVYSRFSSVFPTSVAILAKRIQMENDLEETDKLVGILNEALLQVPNVQLYKSYLDHVRRVLPLTGNVAAHHRQQISDAFDVTLREVGIDPDAGILWRDYLDFLKAGPGNVGGDGWQDRQKVDVLRAAYQRAIKIPHSEFVKQWKEYEIFEMSLHKTNGRKHVQEQSPHYMQCRTAKMQLDQKLDGLDRSSIPSLPPLYDCAGEDEFATQVEKWRAWVAWERDEDPLVYKGTEDEALRQRVLYVYKQATMALYFYPQIWFEAATWCFAQGDEKMAKAGMELLEKGIAANPESVLLAMMKADRIESSLETGNTDEILVRNGEKLDVPYETLHTALYAIRNRQTDKDKAAIAKIKEHFASLPPEDDSIMADGETTYDEDTPSEKPKTRKEQEDAQIEAVRNASAHHLDTLKRVISAIWVAKMQAFRRVQGQGKPVKKGDDSKTPVVKGFRGIFGDARPRGPLSSDVYTASALMEWHCYRDASAIKIFERGMKLFPEDEAFILEYIKHLIAENDVTNARVVFESTVPKIINNAKTSQQQKREKCRFLFAFMHEYESKYGDLAQIHKLEKRMAELYPDQRDIDHFADRFAVPSVDAMHVQIMLSPTQAQLKAFQPHAQQSDAAREQFVPSIETAASPKGPELLLGPNGPYVASPKRPYDDSDGEGRQRKFQRGDSPLKGAAGARMLGKSGNTHISGASGGGGGGGGFATKTFVPSNLSAPPPPAAPLPLPPQLDALLRVLPTVTSYTQTRLDAAKMVGFMGSVNVEHAWQLLQTGQLQRR